MAEDFKKTRGYGKDDNNLYRDRYSVPFPDLKDGTQASSVHSINTDSEKYDLDRMRYDYTGSKGYPSEAWDYDY